MLKEASEALGTTRKTNMPELPEVETVRATLQQAVQGETIAKVSLFYPKLVEGDSEAFLSNLEGKQILSVTRKGKMLCFVLSDGFRLYSHLRMEGRYFLGEPNEHERKFDLCEFDFDSGKALYYNDTRKFGRMLLIQEGEPSPFDELGPEPFDMSAKELLEKLSKRKDTIKQALMDQSLISGIGNIYADETLFACRISPFAPAASIDFNQCESILENSKRILSLAIEEGGSTVRSYHPQEGVNGRMQNELLVYGKPNFPCPNCSFPLRKKFLGGRGTTYCPICQKQEGRAFVLGITGPIHAGKSTAAKYFIGKGYLLFDADACVKELYSRKEVRKLIQKALGRKTFVNGEPNRGYIAQLVSDKEKKKVLEGILHPLVIDEAEKFIRQVGENQKVLIDVPLLFQSGMDGLCDAIILIDADLELRRNRIIQEGRDASSLMKLNRAYPLALARKKASWTIYNNGVLADFVSKLSELPL